MAISKSEFSSYVKAFQFRELFNEMGWNNDRAKQPIIVDDAAYNLSGVAEKSGFRIFMCEPATGGKLPDKITRKKIEAKLTRLFQEHLIIFIDEHRQEQIWQLAVRKAGSPTQISETRFSLSQSPELLYQRASGLFFTLDEEEKVTIIDVTQRVADNFQQNNERVTKKFYEHFKKEHAAFLKFIKGIDDQFHMDWYASLMLNRLMFCYFIQKKGFLDNNKNYLHDKLKACKEKNGHNQFYSFYRDFLLSLFHKGLGAPVHDKQLEVEIGKIPYLNGGLFDVHEIEKTFQHIAIDDKAFEKLFDFFDQYEWHLDTREAASGNDINPDVIGYIFEKYINDRAKMGAYYTKEDITDYIAKNCIVPWLFDEVKRNYSGWLWDMVKSSGDEYIYDAVKFGVPQTGDLFGDLPDEIKKGFAPDLENKVVDGNGPWLWEFRKSWNKPAPSDIALPTEIYREVIERRNRYADIKTRIESGEITEINQFITYNLNIRQFVQDVIETTEDADFIRHFYKAVSSVTILDPTCGSGAFLFAAMNILEPLYEACIIRMKNFVDAAKKGKHKFFEETLAQVNAPAHPNLQYFIYKSIILNNLYGVDIMNEAVEIAKLRLFLKLVATVDANYRKPNLGMEPLPDVDFNIRAGNALVGYATESELDKTLLGTLDGSSVKTVIKEKCDTVAKAFSQYKKIQLEYGDDFDDFKTAKDNLNSRLFELNKLLNNLLHKSDHQAKKYDDWLTSHQPFHWFAEFYEIIAGHGGFDVVIGNPPYVETKDVKSYQLIDYESIKCGDLYSLCMERSYSLLSRSARFGMIVPISIFGTDGFGALQKITLRELSLVWLSIFSNRPSQLFAGAQKRITIIVGSNRKSDDQAVSSTGYCRWRSEERENLFANQISYNLLTKKYMIFSESLEKLGDVRQYNIFNKIIRFKKNIKYSLSNCLTKYELFYTRKFGYFLAFLDFIPKIESTITGEIKLPSELKSFYFNSKEDLLSAISALSSSTFFWFWNVLSDCRNLNRRDLIAFPFNPIGLDNSFKKLLSINAESYISSLKSTSKTMLKSNLIIQTFNYSLSKPIIDQIDCLLAQYYGFTHEELDFIINYDIKYRMGKELDGGEENDV